MIITLNINDVRKHRRQSPAETWGLVPTMGYLHEGHLSLVRRARKENDRVAVSIFLNPIQFNDPRELKIYPRELSRDCALLDKEGVDLVWTPSPEVVYPSGYQTYVEVHDIADLLEGASRPGHFRGVTTVVTKLFNIFQPHRAYFGQKDAQQVLVIRRMTRDLNFNLDIIECPTVREADGVAISSRNVNLSPEEREDATSLYRSLLAAKTAFEAGERNAARLRSRMLAVLKTVKQARVDYVSVAHPETLVELAEIDEQALISLAVFLGEVRLIDNIVLGATP